MAKEDCVRLIKYIGEGKSFKIAVRKNVAILSNKKKLSHWAMIERLHQELFGKTTKDKIDYDAYLQAKYVAECNAIKVKTLSMQEIYTSNKNWLMFVKLIRALLTEGLISNQTKVSCEHNSIKVEDII